MRKAYLFLVILALLALTVSAVAQKNGTVKGQAFDTLSKQAVASATISVLDKKDSSLVTFSSTDNSGRFDLKGIPNGRYRLMISHVNYYNSNTSFTISDSSKNIDLGTIIMNDKNKVLPEVVVSNEDPPITMIGDTVQYNANSFKTQPNANVEQLLKKLPGVRVEKDGTIKAQGEKVTRVLVDGKEFFGNDPKVATKNLPADAVDKVQVYDKQSDQAQLTGFDDNNYEKTINLKLKKDKKKGLFGKVTAGAGNKERYEGRFNINSFKGARQMSVIGMGNNDNAEGFSFTDILNFSGAMSQLRQTGGGSITLSSDDAAGLGLGGQNGGINTAWGSGINYNNIIGTKLDLQSNYFYNRYNPSSQSHTYRENLFQGGVSSYNDEYSYSNNLNNSQRLNLNALYQIDSSSTLRIVPALNYQNTRNLSQTRYSTTGANGNAINDGYSNTLNSSEGYNFKNDLIYRKKFKRKGRTLSLSLQNSFNNSNGDGSLNSVVNYYNAGILYRSDSLNQQSKTDADLHGYSARAVYTEPLWRRSLVEFSVGKSNTKNTSDKTTYDYNKSSEKFDKLNQKLSNDFENNYGYTNAGIRLRNQRRKFNYSLGLTWQKAELEGKITNGIKDSTIKQTFYNLLPNSTFKYNFSRFRTLSVSYSTNTNQPTMSQLQPVPDVSNPLYIKEGNPDLKQEYSHAIRANLNLLSPYKNKNFFLNFNLSKTQNKIASYDSINLLTGVRKSKPVNVNGVYNLNSMISYSFPVHPLKGVLEFSSSVGYNKNKQFVNAVENTIKTLTMGPQLRLDMNPTNKLNLGLSAGYNYNNAKYSIQSTSNNKYFSQEYNASVDYELPKNFFFSTDFMYTVNSQRAAGFNLHVPLWNASISKQFLKYNRGEIKLKASDLLNRNVAISRTANQSYIEDKEVNSLRRFFMLSFTYSLSKSALNNAGPGGFKVIRR